MSYAKCKVHLSPTSNMPELRALVNARAKNNPSIPKDQVWVQVVKDEINRLTAERNQHIAEARKVAESQGWKFTKEPENVATPVEAIKTEPTEAPQGAAEAPSVLTKAEQDWYNKNRDDHHSLKAKYPAEAHVSTRDAWLEDAIGVAQMAIKVGRPGIVGLIGDVPGVNFDAAPSAVLSQLEAKMESNNPAVSPREMQSRVERLAAKMRKARLIAETLRNDSEAAQWLRAMEIAKKAGREGDFNESYLKLQEAKDLQYEHKARKNAGKTSDVVDQMDEVESDTPVPGVDYGYAGVEGIDYSKTFPASPQERTTIDTIWQRLNEWFITPEAARARLTVVQKWEDLSQTVRDRIAEAQKSYNFENAPDKYPGVAFGAYVTVPTPAYAKVREHVVGYWVNPSKADLLKAIAGMNRLGFDGDMRMMQDDKGDTYVFPAFDATHSDLEDALKLTGVVNRKLFARNIIKDMGPEAFGQNAVLLKGYDGTGKWQASKSSDTIQAFVLDGHAYMVADNIKSGNEMAVFLHEVGAHIGLDADQTTSAARGIRTWANAKEGTDERKVFDAATARMEAANETSDSELVAYATEEAVKLGVTPTPVTSAVAKRGTFSKVAEFIGLRARQMFDALKALFGNVVKAPTAQNLVDFTYGAAREAMTRQGGKTDTAPQFSLATSLPSAQQVRDVLDDVKDTKWADKAYTSVLRNFTTLDQLVDIASHMPAFEAFRKTTQLMAKHVKQRVDEVLPTVLSWRALRPAQRTTFDDLLMDAETAGLRPDKPLTDIANKWGSHPSRWAKDKTADPLWSTQAEMQTYYKGLKDRFDALPEADRTRLTSVFNAGATAIKEHMDGVIGSVNRNIADPSDRKEIITKLEKHWEAAISGRPYLPHRWYGDWKLEVVYKKDGKDDGREIMAFDSQREARRMERELKTEGHDARYFRNEEFYSKQSAFSRNALNDINSAIDKNLSGKDAEAMKRAVQEAYYSSLPETAGAQRLRRRKNTKGWQRTDLSRAWGESMNAMARMTAKMQNMDSLRDAVEDAERQSGKTRNIYVLSTWDGTGDNRTNFKAQIIETAADLAKERAKHATTNYHVSEFSPKEGKEGLTTTLKYAPNPASRDLALAMLGPQADQIRDTFNATRKDSETKAKDDALVDALKYRYEQMLKADSSHPISTFFTTAGFLWYLGWTPAFAIMNVTQVPMLTAPRLAAKFGGTSAMGALRRAYGLMNQNRDVLVKLMRAATVAQGESDVIDINHMKEMTDGQKKMLKEMLDRGALDFTQDTEMLSLVRGTPEAMQRLIKSATWLAHPTEVANRMVTALAAYDLASKTQNDATAYDTVYKIVQETQMNYSPENRMVFLNNPVARPLLMFRQFGQQVTYMLGKAMKESFSKDPETRREQRAMLMYTLLSSGLLGGVNGLPFMGTILMLASALFGDDDEPFDARYELGKALGPLLANGGIGAWLTDWSKRVGLGDALPIPGLSGSVSTAPKATRKEKLKDAVFDAMGPAGSIMGGGLDALDWFDKGDYLRGIEAALPKAGKDMLKGARYAQDGLTSSDGITRVGANDFSVLDLIASAAGFKPAVEGEVMADANYLYARRMKAALRAGLLTKQMVMAREDGDDTDSIQEKIDAFNEANPVHAITAKHIRQAERAKHNKQNIADMLGGIGFTKKDRELADQLGLTD